MPALSRTGVQGRNREHYKFLSFRSRALFSIRGLMLEPARYERPAESLHPYMRAVGNVDGKGRK